MSAPTIWDFGTPPSTKDENSKAAADSMLGRVGSIRQIVAHRIMVAGPISEEWLEHDLGYSGNTIRPRIVELARAGIIVKAEKKGRTRSGRECWEWLATDMGRRLILETER